MVDVVLGKKPKTLLVNLYPSQDFTEAVQRSVNGEVVAWPDGAVVTLHVGDQSWPARIDGLTAYWDVDKLDVAKVKGNAASITLTYGTVDELLAVGTASLGRG